MRGKFELFQMNVHRLLQIFRREPVVWRIGGVGRVARHVVLLQPVAGDRDRVL